MATKTILKNLAITEDKQCKDLVKAMEEATLKKGKKINIPNASNSTIEDIKKMFHIEQKERE